MFDISNTIIVGLGFGDEGKGTTTDFLCHQNGVRAVVRYNGGCQAGHHVVSFDGRKHCFSQFGSGTLVPDVRTHLSSQMLVKLTDLQDENDELVEAGVIDAFDRLTIDPACHLVMPYHAMIGRLREAARSDQRHGTTGKGVGEAVDEWRQKGSGALIAQDLNDSSEFQSKALGLWKEYCALGRQLIEKTASPEVEAVYQDFVDSVDVEAMTARQLKFADQNPGCFVSDSDFFSDISDGLVLEGAQGTMLHEELGWVPHITKSNTLAAHGEKLLAKNGITRKPVIIGILRAYSTRHGFGPFTTFAPELTELLPEPHLGDNVWSGAFRCGWLDLVTAQYAVELNGNIDSLSVSCLDRLSALPEVKVCIGYRYCGIPTQDLDTFFEWREIVDGAIEIKRILPRHDLAKEDAIRRTQMIKECVPMSFCVSDHWDAPKSVSEPIPDEMQKYLDYIEERLNVPISIASIGPTAEDKYRF